MPGLAHFSPHAAWWQRLGGQRLEQRDYRGGSLCFVQLKQFISRRSPVGNCASFILNAPLKRESSLFFVGVAEPSTDGSRPSVCSH